MKNNFKLIGILFCGFVCTNFLLLQATKQAVVLYSGGLDSSAVVGKFAAQKYSVLHLVTCDNGAQRNMDLSKIKIVQFKEKFPNTEFKHVILPVHYLFKKISLIDIEDDIPKYKTNLVCVGCKMSMHAQAIIYALENKIELVVDGFAKRQEDFPEQDLVFIKLMRAIYEKYNLRYQCPLYDEIQNKQDVKDLLSRYDLSTKSIEGECLFGDTFSPAKSEKIEAYFKDKTEVVINYIDTCLAEIGICSVGMRDK